MSSLPDELKYIICSFCQMKDVYPTCLLIDWNWYKTLSIRMNPKCIRIIYGCYEYLYFIHMEKFCFDEFKSKAQILLRSPKPKKDCVEVFKNPTNPNENYINMLNLAVSNNHYQSVKYLIQHCNINTENKRGETPLFISCARGNLEISRELISGGAIVKCENNNHLTPLIMACRSGYVDLVNLILDHDDDMYKIYSESGKSAILDSRSYFVS